MLLGKVALILVAIAIISPHPVICNNRCTEEQKKLILLHCEKYIKKGSTVEPPNIHTVCCENALEVPNLDMHCIVEKLTKKEKEEHDETKILSLHRHCHPYYRPPPPHQVQITCNYNG